ncbi:hypothetical protein PHPALM_31552 [Phytophthora palmivora]|uniref:MULE transposase domain-containing protein n=1 Tax=Phytophthora palmivora TaxID=4796 RepID=A0A2P4X2A3_9STRA|nr:hypothetical protein PHPALM_31552 [Phytophthora palmivora]
MPNSGAGSWNRFQNEQLASTKATSTHARGHHLRRYLFDVLSTVPVVKEQWMFGRTHAEILPSRRLEDVKEDMKAMTDSLAISDVVRPARQIWHELRGLYYGFDNNNVVIGLSESQVISRVHRARAIHYSGDVHGSVEIPPLSLALNEAVSFFQFHFVSANRQDVNRPNRLLGWAHPVLLNLLRYNNTTLFIDGTFRCVPRNYQQRVVYMVHDHASRLFVPVFYILSTSRTGDAYWDMMHFVLQATDQ